MKAHKYFVVSIWVLFLVAMAAAAQKTNDKAATGPVVAEADKIKIREFQLRDSRVSDAIKLRQLEIVSLQAQQQQNAKEFQAFVGGVCKNDSYEFEMSNDEPKCIPKKSPVETRKK